MALGARTIKMAPDVELVKSRVPTDVVPHPSKPGFTIACRNDGTVNEGNYYEKPEGVPDTWFCADPDCQEAFIRRQKLLRWQQRGSPPLVRKRTPLDTPPTGPPIPIDVSEFVPDRDVI